MRAELVAVGTRPHALGREVVDPGAQLVALDLGRRQALLGRKPCARRLARLAPQLSERRVGLSRMRVGGLDSLGQPGFELGDPVRGDVDGQLGVGEGSLRLVEARLGRRARRYRVVALGERLRGRVLRRVDSSAQIGDAHGKPRVLGVALLELRGQPPDRAVAGGQRSQLVGEPVPVGTRVGELLLGRRQPDDGVLRALSRVFGRPIETALGERLGRLGALELGPHLGSRRLLVA